jgi:ketosteroid isomerase-like protein
VFRAFDAMARGDDEAALECLDANAEWHTTGAFLEQSMFRGHDEIRRFIGLFRESFEDFRAEAELVAEREGALLIAGRLMGRGRGSGLEVDVPRSWLFVVRGGKVAHVRTFEGLDAGRRAFDEVPPQG